MRPDDCQSALGQPDDGSRSRERETPMTGVAPARIERRVFPAAVASSPRRSKSALGRDVFTTKLPAHRRNRAVYSSMRSRAISRRGTLPEASEPVQLAFEIGSHPGRNGPRQRPSQRRLSRGSSPCSHPEPPDLASTPSHRCTVDGMVQVRLTVALVIGVLNDEREER